MCSSRAPQVVLASWYRMYTGVMGYLGIPTKTCWSVNRGEGLTPVDSCEGTDHHHGAPVSSENICLHTHTYTRAPPIQRSLFFASTVAEETKSVYTCKHREFLCPDTRVHALLELLPTAHVVESCNTAARSLGQKETCLHASIDFLRVNGQISSLWVIRTVGGSVYAGCLHKPDTRCQKVGTLPAAVVLARRVCFGIKIRPVMIHCDLLFNTI